MLMHTRDDILLTNAMSLLLDTSRKPLWIPAEYLTAVSGPSCAAASTSVLHSWESRERRGSATRPVTSCAQKVPGAQVLALRLAFLWVSGLLLFAHSSFSVSSLFFTGEMRRLGPTSRAYSG